MLSGAPRDTSRGCPSCVTQARLTSVNSPRRVIVKANVGDSMKRRAGCSSVDNDAGAWSEFGMVMSYLRGRVCEAGSTERLTGTMHTKPHEIEIKILLMVTNETSLIDPPTNEETSS